MKRRVPYPPLQTRRRNPCPLHLTTPSSVWSSVQVLLQPPGLGSAPQNPPTPTCGMGLDPCAPNPKGWGKKGTHLLLIEGKIWGLSPNAWPFPMGGHFKYFSLSLFFNANRKAFVMQFSMGLSWQTAGWRKCKMRNHFQQRTGDFINSYQITAKMCARQRNSQIQSRKGEGLYV